MNADRRKRLDEAHELITEAQSILQDVGFEEQEAFDNMSEGLQQTEKSQRMEEVASELDDLASTLDDVLSGVEGAKE